MKIWKFGRRSGDPAARAANPRPDTGEPSVPATGNDGSDGDDGASRARVAGIVGQVSTVVRTVGAGATQLVAQLPEALRSTREAAQEATGALQTLPDSTLRWMAASSVGVCAGFILARAPRLAIAVGAAPAIVIGAAIALRPAEPVISTTETAT